MTVRRARSAFFVLMLTIGAARAATAQTCIKIDEPHDMLTAQERTAAILLIGKQFELAGHRIAERDCSATYLVSHIRLGTTITVTLSGPTGSREGTALGLDDLPAVYSQVVRSLLTGQPMGSLAVLNRANVSAAQDSPARRLRGEGAWYARVGYGGIFGPSTRSGAAFGLGYRAEFDRLGLDISFINAQLADNGSYYSGSSSSYATIKLQGLVFTNPTSNQTAYFGAGLSYGNSNFSVENTDTYPSFGHGSGLQAGLSAGYEIARVTSARLFVQADVTLPFYHVRVETYSYTSPTPNSPYVPPTVAVRSYYVPSLAVSVGLGWSRRSH